MTDYEFMLEDRIAKIKAINEQYNLEENAYLAFSGGKDSTILHHLLDLAIPGNKIPRVYDNTGIEYKLIREFVKEMAKTDERIIIINAGVNLKKMYQEEGYPFKSKEHSMRVADYKKGSTAEYIKKYITGKTKDGKETKFKCPEILKYQFTPENKLKISRACCYKLKKEPMHKWAKENKKTIVLTGMRSEEGGNRRNMGCAIVKEGKLEKFHPLMVVTAEWEKEFIERERVALSKLYKPPFNFERTGCKGCPYNQRLSEDLQILKELLPNEYKQCEILWKPVYDEYRRIGYRLTSKIDKQISIWDFIEEGEE